jgi:DNA invertase Pin-like site-specific DNA recombinase
VSPDDQVTSIQRVCEREEMRLIKVNEEIDVSAFRRPLERRPGLYDGLQMIERGEADVLVVAYFDRFFRRMKVQAEVCDRVERAGGRLLSVDVGEISQETAAKWLSANMLGLVSEFQSRLISDKVKEPHRRALANGIPAFASIPPGYLRGPDRRLVVDEAKALLVHEAYERRAAGARLVEVDAWCRSVGLTKSWRATQELLRNRIYLGELKFGKLVNPVSHQPIIEKALFDSVQSMRPKLGPRETASSRLLAHQKIVFCGTCNAPMAITGTTKHAKGGTKQYQSYACYRYRDCKGPAFISADLLERTVIAVIKQVQAEGQASMDDRVVVAELEAEAALQTLNQAVAAFDGLGDVAATRTKLLELRAEHQAAQERLEALRTALGSRKRATPAVWEAMTLHEQRALIRAVINRVIVRRGGRGPERITIELFEE